MARKTRKQRKQEKRVKSLQRIYQRKEKARNTRLRNEYQKQFDDYVKKKGVLNSTNQYQRTTYALKHLGINVNGHKLTEEEITKLSNTSVLSNFYESTIAQNAYNPDKYLSEIGVRIGRLNYKGITQSNAMRTAEIFVDEIYNMLAEVGLITSKEVIEYTNQELYDDISMDDFHRGLEKMLDDFTSGKEEASNIKGMILNYIFESQEESDETY